MNGISLKWLSAMVDNVSMSIIKHLQLKQQLYYNSEVSKSIGQYVIMAYFVQYLLE